MHTHIGNCRAWVSPQLSLPKAHSNHTKGGASVFLTALVLGKSPSKEVSVPGAVGIVGVVQAQESQAQRDPQSSLRLLRTWAYSASGTQLFIAFLLLESFNINHKSFLPRSFT